MKTLGERFWPKVIKHDGCWQWTGARHPFGYGMLRQENSGQKITASRASWLIHFGDIPPGMYVCHKCDNPECTNPEHLFLGTATDNARDKENKGRGLRKFDQQTCNAIYTLISLGASKRSVARAFQTYRNSIETAMQYGVMLPPVDKKPKKERKPKSPPPIGIGAKNGRAKLTDADVIQIRALRAQGLSNPEIAAKFAVGSSMVSHICNRRCWTHI